MQSKTHTYTTPLLKLIQISSSNNLSNKFDNGLPIVQPTFAHNARLPIYKQNKEHMTSANTSYL